MSKKTTIITIMSVTVLAITGCGETKEDEPNVNISEITFDNISAGLAEGKGDEVVIINQETLDAVESLNDIQTSYSNGVAPLIEIPYVWAEEIYNNYDELVEAETANIPILLREYAATNIVYLDYASGYSVVWDKNTNAINVEQSNVDDMNDYMQRQHK